MRNNRNDAQNVEKAQPKVRPTVFPEFLCQQGCFAALTYTSVVFKLDETPIFSKITEIPFCTDCNTLSTVIKLSQSAQTAKVVRFRSKNGGNGRKTDR